MKKSFKLLLVFMLSIVLTGCAKYNVSMEVGKDKTVTLEIIYGLIVSDVEVESDIDEEGSNVVEDDSLTDEEKSSITEDDSWVIEEEPNNVDDYKYLEDKGFKVESYVEETDEGTIEGIKLTKIYANIDDITKDEKIVVDFNNRFNSELSNSFDDSGYFYREGNKYVANFIFDFSEEGDEDLSSLDSLFDLEYKIKLPKKSSNNNATTVSEDGKELTWDLKYGEVNEVNFAFNLEDNTMPIIILVAIGGTLLIGVLVGIIVLYNTNKKKHQIKEKNS